MSNAFTNFLGGVVSGVLGDKLPTMRDAEHANRLYVRETYARAPKFGFLYFVSFNINTNAIVDKSWNQVLYNNVGLLVKAIDLPKFQVKTEVMNQYNRKTVVQKAIEYQPVNINFHDDNSNITRDLWKNYFQYYYADSAYGNTTNKNSLLEAFSDTKYKAKSFNYGLNNKQSNPFFKSIDIYVLHQQKFSQYTLVNPLVTQWDHDTLDQASGDKILQNKMTVMYETVIYNQGSIKTGEAVDKFRAFYDNTPSPLSIGGGGTKTIAGPGGLLAGASSIFGILGKENKSPLDYLGAALNAKTLIKNAKNISKDGLKQEGYSILKGVLGDVQVAGNQPGGVGTAVQTGINQSIQNISNATGIKIFSNQNSSVNGTTTTTPSKLTGGG